MPKLRVDTLLEEAMSLFPNPAKYSVRIQENAGDDFGSYTRIMVFLLWHPDTGIPEVTKEAATVEEVLVHLRAEAVRRTVLKDAGMPLS